MDNNPLDDIDEEKVDHLIPESPTPPGAMDFSAEIQREKFISGVSPETEEGVPHTIETQERKIASTIEELPPLEKNYVRLIHTTSPNNVEGILEKGLDYDIQGMIDSTARAFSDPESIQYYSDDPRFSYEGAKSIIFDVPLGEYRLHRDVTKSPGVVPAEHIVGVIEAHKDKE